MSRTSSYTIGSDPEFFLYDTERKAYVSAHDKVPGDKKNPHKLPDGSAVQADGTAIEFNTEPTNSSAEFKQRILSALNEIRKIVPAKYAFHFEPYIRYTPAIWKDIPIGAKTLGCDPDYTAAMGYSQVAYLNHIPDPGNIRTGSGHIHIGWTKNANTDYDSQHYRECTALIYNLDYYMRSSFNYWDDKLGVREQYYGASRAFRCKSYGVEYRSPSNAWLKFPDLYETIAEMVMHGTELSAEAKYLNSIPYDRLGNPDNTVLKAWKYPEIPYRGKQLEM